MARMDDAEERLWSLMGANRLLRAEHRRLREQNEGMARVLSALVVSNGGELVIAPGELAAAGCVLFILGEPGGGRIVWVADGPPEPCIPG